MIDGVERAFARELGRTRNRVVLRYLVNMLDTIRNVPSHATAQRIELRIAYMRKVVADLELAATVAHGDRASNTRWDLQAAS